MSREVILEMEDIKSGTEGMKREVELVENDTETDVLDTKNKHDVKTDSDMPVKEESRQLQSKRDMAYADDDEDVPSDFFDDFSNQDFMAGLDIVDAWDDEDESGNVPDNRDQNKLDSRGVKQDKSKNGNNEPKSSSHSTRRTADKRRYPRERSRDYRDQKRRHKGDKDKNSTVEEKDTEKAEKNIQKTELDRRRDPEKTKRDIQKDKVKQTKSKEAKIISEKLKVVETGLVPPGTEMEVDLEELKSNIHASNKSKSTSFDKEHGDNQTEKHNTREERRSTHEERQDTKEERRSSNRRTADARNDSGRSRYGRYSPRNFERRVRYRSRSPYNRRKSPLRLSHLDYIRGRNSPERRIYNQEPRRFRHYRDTSPTIIRRDRSLSLSPLSAVSEREMWLHSRENRNRRKSPLIDDGKGKSGRSQDFLEELAVKLNSDKKKKSLLKEIHAKLNEPSSSRSHYSLQRGPLPVPVPAPAPPMPNMPMGMPPDLRYMQHPDPGQYYPPMADPNSQYDQQFFIGQPVFPNLHPYPEYTDPNMTSNPINLQNTTAASNNVDILKKQSLALKKKDKEAAAKLFEDKKITLSDFLSVSAKDTDANPINVQQKVKVISLCQDAVRTIGEGWKFAGRFFVKRSHRDLEKKEDLQFQSPLRGIPVVRFAFTTPSKTADEKSQNDLNKLLISLGVIQQRPVSPAISPVISETPVKSVVVKAPVTMFPKTYDQTPVKMFPKKYDPMLGAKFQMKMCQTDPVKCGVCEIRKARRFVDQGVQCEIESVDSGTQMSEEDQIRFGIKMPLKDNLKNQSLAHLTPAQILAQASSEDSPKKNTFSGSRMLASPQSDTPRDFRMGPSPNEGFPRRTEYMDKYPEEQFRNQVGRPNMSGNSREHFDLGPRPNFNKRANDNNRFRENYDDRDFEPDNFDNPRDNFDNPRDNFDNPREPRYPPNNRGNFHSGRYSGRAYY